MGGSAFPHLHVPRLTLVRYQKLCDYFISITRSLYTKVIAPPEAPGKVDHGDIDLIVADSVAGPEVPIQKVQEVLGAVATKGDTSKGSTLSLVIPDPESSEHETNHAYIQVDIHVCREGTYIWEVFTKSYGDLWNILGSQIRPVGLTANDRGLFVRDPEIEELNRKQAMVFLSRDPDKVLNFLGLDYPAFEKGWTSQAEMFQWAIKCRFLDREVFREKGVNLKANDRKRLKARPMYRDFVFNFIPSLPVSCEPTPIPSRAAVLEEALDKFDVRHAREAQLLSFRRELRERQAWLAVQDEALQEPVGNSAKRKRGKLMTALKQRISLKEGEEPSIKDEDLDIPGFLNDEGEIDKAALVKWVKNNWESVKAKVSSLHSGDEDGDEEVSKTAVPDG